MRFVFRLTEKNEEIRTLRSLLESDRSRIEILSVELENARRELHGNYDKTEKLKTQIFSLESEVKVVNDLREAVDALRAENHTATSKWKQEMVEKAQINARAEKLADSLEEIQLLLRQREDELESSKMELNRLLRDKVELGSKAENIENISRENERLKAANEKIQAELIDYNTRYNELKSEFSLAREELQRQNAEMSRIKDAVDSSRQQANEYKSERDEVEEMYHTEKGKLAAAEATVSELRSILVSVRGDYEKERNEKLVTSRELESNLEKIDELQHQLGTACVMCYVAMAKWDNALSTALDGDTFSDGSSNAANTISTHNRLTLYGSNNNNHPSRHKQHHNYRSWEETEEDEMKLEVLSLSSEQILQRTAVQIERIQLKIDRAGKIRKLFESQAKRMMESTQQSVQIVQEKSALLFHRVSEANLETKRVESIFLRDRKQREDEFIELKRFRESLVNEHSSQLRESDARAVTAKERLEQEQRSAEKLRLENQRLHEEIRSLQRAYDDLKEDINDLTLAEQVVSDLNHRVNELMNVNRSLSKEVEEKQSTILNLRHDHHQIMQEKTSLLTNMEKQYSQLQARDELISDYEAKLNRFLKEIERLRARQINPELAQTILDTQSWVNGTQKNIANTNRYHSSAVSSPNEKIAASERGFSDASDQLLSITQLTTSADVLIARSADMVSRFESIVDSLKSPRPSLRDSATIKSFEQDLFELLESNSKLTLHLHQVASELKRFIRRSMDQKIETASHDVLPPSTLKYDAPHYSRPPISSDGAVNTHHGTPFVHKDMTIAELTADGLHSGIKATPVPPPKEFIDDDYIPRRTTNLSGFKSHFPMNTIRSQQLSSDRRENFSSEREVKSSNSILLQTPNTAARASAARLSKLGSDLNELARKLDAFDSYDGSKR